MTNEIKNVFYEGKVLWAQLDANIHLRHSAYADFAAQARLEMLQASGFGPLFFSKLKTGPILFREELIYLREVHAGETLRITCELSRCRPDGSRWSFHQEIFRGDGVKAAITNVDGAWINTETRKLTALPADVVQSFLRMPLTADFVMETPEEKQSL